MPRETDFTYFHEWDGLAENWITDEESFDKDFPTKPFDPNSRTYSSVAEWIVEVIFGLETSSDSRDKGSTLPGYDIKSRDAYQMIQLSLATELAEGQGHLVECYADGNGVVHFYIIGETNSSINSSHIFYSINTSTLSKQCDNVLVIGYDPPPKRYTGKPFNLFTFKDRIETGWATAITQSITDDKDHLLYPIYHTWGDILGPEQCPYYREGYIEYGDTLFEQDLVLQKLGITDPALFETVSTYIYKITVPWFKQASTDVKFSSTTPKFIELKGGDGNPDFGKLQERQWKTNVKYIASLCAETQTTDSSRGKRLPRSNEKKFLGVREVYIHGYKLKQIRLDFYRSGDNIVTGGADFLVDLDSALAEPFRLSRGQDYVVVDDPSDPDYKKIVFSANIHPDYLDNFGGSVGGAIKATVRIAPSSIYDPDTQGRKEFVDLYDPSNVISGKLKDGETDVNNQAGSTALPPFNEAVTIFPMNEGQSGYIVEKIVVIYDWNNPCVAVRDEENNVTALNLSLITVEVYPMITRDEKPPISWTHGGRTELLDPLEVIPDYEADTIEDLESKTYARAFTSLETGDIKITLPFLDADQCQTVSAFIYDMQNEVIKQTNYICSPAAEPVLGELIEGKTINSIDYSYQDGSQYLISVNAGPIWMGISGWDTSLYQNKTERIQLEGIVTGVDPSNMKCQVQIEQIGMMDCVNSTKSILEKGDRVAVTIHNNPVAK
ncbi:hypothetical protein LCGC14_0716980 [marine sediment metagenome]|uniref:Uncharacterized protein n=1 Tax=marine sediment metagenome TaxID=412755 RepID=A0A0F9QDE3_9ZZZZ|nr:hypothetical protein [bacterium]